jgi:nucleoside-triphosphatase
VNLFLTGGIQVGKSTIINRYVSAHGYRVGGFKTLAQPRGTDGSSAVHILRADGSEPFSADNVAFLRHGPHARKGLTVYPERYDGHGVALLRAAEDCDLLLMDELGPKEEDALAFQQAVLDCLEGPIPVLGVVMKRPSPFLDRVRTHPRVKLVEVTVDNREEILDSLPPVAEWRQWDEG